MNKLKSNLTAEQDAELEEQLSKLYYERNMLRIDALEYQAQGKQCENQAIAIDNQIDDMLYKTRPITTILEDDNLSIINYRNQVFHLMYNENLDQTLIFLLMTENDPNISDGPIETLQYMNYVYGNDLFDYGDVNYHENLRYELDQLFENN